MGVSELPDISRLDTLTADEWLHIGEQLRALGLEGQAARELGSAGASVLGGRHRSLRIWHLRRSEEPAAALLRMFAFGDLVACDEAAGALGGLSLQRLVDCGLLVRDGDSVVSPLRLSLLEGILVLGDEPTAGADAVMGAGQTTRALCQASYPSAPVGRILDMGCGAGSVSLALSSRAGAIVATDINSRAITLARHNAALNGIVSVQFREGDLFAAVDAEAFDLIVAQPPFIPLAEGAAATTFLHGGPRGDELALRVLAELPAHLAPGGRTVLFSQWPVGGELTLEQRVRAAIGSDHMSVLVLRCPPSGVDDYCAKHAAWFDYAPGPGTEQQAERMREHLEEQGVAGMQTAIVVIQHCDGGPPWTSGIDVPATTVTHITSARIDRFVRARDVLARGVQSLLGATLRLPAGTALHTWQEIGSPDSAMLELTFPDDALCFATRLDQDGLAIIGLCAEAPDVASAVRELERRGTASQRESLDVIRAALLRGVLEVAASQRAAA